MGACDKDTEGIPTGQIWDSLGTKVQSKLLEKQEYIIHTNNKKGCGDALNGVGCTGRVKKARFERGLAFGEGVSQTLFQGKNIPE